ncbi:hypothetical protein GQ55_4G308700 [Panicum hallii var. hallii]|uniref:Uncharacterized protein n=1 Tax=Panicum hallii var. hallii TaxID=1504633 RepID=A0A2T7E1Z8_9POAL|nr:hypothetical protein GQ55_4G308700 [Panicum hallii var. hallii]
MKPVMTSANIKARMGGPDKVCGRNGCERAFSNHNRLSSVFLTQSLVEVRGARRGDLGGLVPSRVVPCRRVLHADVEEHAWNTSRFRRARVQQHPPGWSQTMITRTFCSLLSNSVQATQAGPPACAGHTWRSASDRATATASASSANRPPRRIPGRPGTPRAPWSGAPRRLEPFSSHSCLHGRLAWESGTKSMNWIWERFPHWILPKHPKLFGFLVLSITAIWSCMITPQKLQCLLNLGKNLSICYL